MDSSTVMEQNIPIEDCEPPSEYGLSNCNVIIPPYYHPKNYQKIIDIDYYIMIIDDIRNFRKLNSFQIDFIRQLEDADKMMIIHEFNQCIDAVSSILDN
jgi:hypothetical protein